MATVRYAVIAAAVQVMDEQRARHILYFGAPVPEYVKGDQLQRLVDELFIAPVDVPIVVVPADGSTPVELVPAAGVVPVELVETGATLEVGKAPVSGAEPVDPEDEVPAGNAANEVWRAYAIGKGVPEEEAKGLSRGEIMARLGL